MPSYRNPRFAYIEPRYTGGLPVAAAVLAVIGYAAYQLADWIASAVVAVLAVVALVAVTSVVTLAVVVRRQRGRQHLDAPQWVVERCGAARIPSSGAIPGGPPAAVTAAPRPAIGPPAVHYHLHLHAALADEMSAPIAARGGRDAGRGSAGGGGAGGALHDSTLPEYAGFTVSVNAKCRSYGASFRAARGA
jgi:hypothetical protein